MRMTSSEYVLPPLPSKMPSSFIGLPKKMLSKTVMVHVLSFLYTNRRASYTKKEIAKAVSSNNIRKIENCLYLLCEEKIVSSKDDDTVPFSRKLYKYNP